MNARDEIRRDIAIADGLNPDENCDTCVYEMPPEAHRAYHQKTILPQSDIHETIETITTPCGRYKASFLALSVGYATSAIFRYDPSHPTKWRFVQSQGWTPTDRPGYSAADLRSQVLEDMARFIEWADSDART